MGIVVIISGEPQGEVARADDCFATERLRGERRLGGWRSALTEEGKDDKGSEKSRISVVTLLIDRSISNVSQQLNSQPWI